MAEERYLQMLAELGPQGAPPTRLRAARPRRHGELRRVPADVLAAIKPWLLAVLAVSLNSPWSPAPKPACSRRGPRGCWSCRALGSRRRLPRRSSGRRRPAPRASTTRGAGGMRAPTHGSTLEVRIADQPTSVDWSAALAALIQALCAAPPPPADGSRDGYLCGEPRRRTARDLVDELLELVRLAALELGTWTLVESLRGPVEALRQLETGRRDGLVGGDRRAGGAVGSAARRVLPASACPGATRAQELAVLLVSPRHRGRSSGAPRRRAGVVVAQDRARSPRRWSGSRTAAARSGPSGSGCRRRATRGSPPWPAAPGPRSGTRSTRTRPGSSSSASRRSPAPSPASGRRAAAGARHTPLRPAAATVHPGAARCCASAAKGGFLDPRACASSRWARPC